MKELDEFMQMYNNKEIAPVVNFGREDYEKAINMEPRKAYEYIGNNVKVIIDRKLGSNHPKYKFIYSVNYGYVPNTVNGDGEELDCYILGIDEPIEEFEGRCIAVIHRLNDDDDKLIVVPAEKEFTDNEIKELTNFQEQYFQSEIIR